jgi:tRNA uridine 5-carbamoylmethylation protein Kti12
MKTLVVNFYGGPGTGKSTMTNRVFSELKDLAYNVEIATEYAKDLTWEESHAVLDNQVYVFGKQQHRIWRLNNKVQIILTDSPLLFSLVYRIEKTSILFKYFVQDEFSRYNNMNIYLNRVKPYNPIGRNQTEDEAKQTVIKRSEEQGEPCHYEQVGEYYIVYRTRDRKVMKNINYFKPDLKKFF